MALVAIAALALLIALASLARSESAPFVSPVVTRAMQYRPTIPAPDYTLTPTGYLPAIFMNHSPLPTPTVTATPEIRVTLP